MNNFHLHIKFLFKTIAFVSLLLNTNLCFGNSYYHQSTETVKAWETLISHPILRKDPNIINKASSVLDKEHITSGDITEILRVNSGLGQRAEAVGNLLDDLDHFALYKDRDGFSAIISGLKADWFNGAGADGANWVIAALKKEGTGVFPPSKTRFEINNANGRRYDAIVTVPPNNYFEFKSYSSVPPANFEDQFIKDLNNAEITNLSQLKWYFDKAKNPPNFINNMEAAIDGLDLSLSKIPATTLQKFGVNSEAGLRTILDQNFSSIFNLK